MRQSVLPKPGVQSVDVTLRVLLAVAQGSGPRPLKDIAAAAKMAPSSAHRHLTSLVRAGMIEQHDATGRYDLGPLVLDLGMLALARRDPVRLIGSSLEELRDQLDETVFLAVWGNRGPTIVRWEESARAITVNVRVGSVMPLMRSATGRVFLTWLQPATTAELLRRERAARKQVDVLRRTTRQRGLGCVEGDLLPGSLHCLHRSSTTRAIWWLQSRPWGLKATSIQTRKDGSAELSKKRPTGFPSVWAGERRLLIVQPRVLLHRTAIIRLTNFQQLIGFPTLSCQSLNIQ